MLCLFVCSFGVIRPTREFFSHYRRRTTNLNLYSALTSIEQRTPNKQTCKSTLAFICGIPMIHFQNLDYFYLKSEFDDMRKITKPHHKINNILEEIWKNQMTRIILSKRYKGMLSLTMVYMYIKIKKKSISNQKYLPHYIKRECLDRNLMNIYNLFGIKDIWGSDIIFFYFQVCREI